MIHWQALAADAVNVLIDTTPIWIPYILAELVAYLRAHRKAAAADILAANSAKISAIADRAAAFAEKNADAAIAKQGPFTTGNIRYDAFANFMIGQAEQTLANNGIDVSTPDGQMKLARMAAARLEKLGAVKIAAGIPPTK